MNIEKDTPSVCWSLWVEKDKQNFNKKLEDTSLAAPSYNIFGVLAHS